LIDYIVALLLFLGSGYAISLYARMDERIPFFWIFTAPMSFAYVVIAMFATNSLSWLPNAIAFCWAGFAASTGGLKLYKAYYDYRWPAGPPPRFRVVRKIPRVTDELALSMDTDALARWIESNTKYTFERKDGAFGLWHFPFDGTVMKSHEEAVARIQEELDSWRLSTPHERKKLKRHEGGETTVVSSRVYR